MDAYVCHLPERFGIRQASSLIVGLSIRTALDADHFCDSLTICDVIMASSVRWRRKPLATSVQQVFQGPPTHHPS